MASSTHPPAGSGTTDPVSSLYLSDTFYTWFNVSNDLINKVNPIEVYSITADQRSYTTVGADGITIDDLGFGNFRIGYIHPANITGGHTFHGNIIFNAGASGPFVNNVNGKTGAVDAVQTVSGYTAAFNGMTGNVEGAIFEINGQTGTTFGQITLDVQGVLTGDAGTIAAATGGAGFSFDKRIKFFSSAADTNADQIALRVRGTTADASVGIGVTGPDKSFALQIDASNMNSLGSATAGGISVNTDVMDNYDIKMSGVGAVASGATLYIVSGHTDNTGEVVFKNAQAGGQTAPSAGSDLLRVDSEGVVLTGKVKDNAGSAAGATGSILASTSGSKVEWILPSSTHINTGTQTGLTLPTGTGQASAAGGFPINSNENTPMRFTATGLSTSNGNESSWDDRLVMIFMTLLGTENSGDNFPILEIYHDTSTSTSAPTFTTDHKNAFLQRGDGVGMAYGTTTYTIAYRQPAGGSIWWKYVSIGTTDNNNLAMVGYSVVVI
jgi:hypothetical protein